VLEKQLLQYKTFIFSYFTLFLTPAFNNRNELYHKKMLLCSEVWCFFHKFLPQIKTITCSLYVVSMRFLCCFYVGQKFTLKNIFSKIYLVPSKLFIYIKFRQKVNLLVSETQGREVPAIGSCFLFLSVGLSENVSGIWQHTHMHCRNDRIVSRFRLKVTIWILATHSYTFKFYLTALAASQQNPFFWHAGPKKCYWCRVHSGFGYDV